MLPDYLNVEFLPDLTMESFDVSDKPSFAIENLGSLGVSVKPLTDLIFKATIATGGSGLYMVNTKGLTMFKAKSDGGFIGSLKALNGGVGGGQARLTPIPIDPISISVSVAVMAIESKLNTIIEDQKAIMKFLEIKEEAKIRSNVNSLLDILNNYKYNFNNPQYKQSNHGLVKMIKKETDESILLFDQLLNKKADEKKGLHFDKKVEDNISDSVSKLNSYQLALYGFAFASLLDMILLDNFHHDYLKSILGKINEHQEKYNTTFIAIEQQIFQESSTSVQTNLTKGLSKISAGLGKFIRKLPLLGKTELDENLISSSEKLTKMNEEKVASKVKILSSTRKNLIKPFIDNIKCLDLIYNESVNLLFDNKNVYIDM